MLDTSTVVARLRAAGCVFAEDEADLLIAAATTPAELDSLVERRVAGLPLEHLLGWAEFHGLRISLRPGVFVPRHRTEFLVDVAVSLAPPQPVVLDLCCGSGALGAAFSAVVAPRELHAADVEPAAVSCARVNLPGAGVHQGDLYDALPSSLGGRVDVLMANVPYVPSDAVATMPPEARLHEPRVALDGGADGLDLARRVAAGAYRWLAPGGSLLVESSERQAPVLSGIFTAAGLTPRVHESEELGATVVTGTAIP
ncbi:N5-glutamine S-adenosyl-L-methionine-dependent methyltransferase [Amycolatopsis sp. NBRC 101858]|nr:N5-glutamine S-adenosyl-L-methionine-dependent methyltransferase [Amycolatopsis sp. NBRC 101858]